MFIISFINVSSDGIVIYGLIGLRKFTGVTKRQAKQLYREEYKASSPCYE